MYKCFNLYSNKSLKEQLALTDDFLYSFEEEEQKLLEDNEVDENFGEDTVKDLYQCLLDEEISFQSDFEDVKKKQIHADLKSYLDATFGQTDLLSGAKIQKDYFPQVQADMFLSHSHDDERLALRLKFVLERLYGLKVFVDSCVWGYWNDLLNEINKKYHLSNKDRLNTITAIQLMLSTALTKMLDQCECVIFLNTQHSNLKISSINQVQTASPWIYHELSTSKLLRRKIPGRESLGKRIFTEEGKIPSIYQTVSIENLTKIELKSFLDWLCKQTWGSNTRVLDNLYSYLQEKNCIG